jgi:hypothetical protein
MDEQQPGGAGADIRLVDAEGYQAQPRDLAFAGVDDAAIRTMQRQETPLGFASHAQWLQCLAELHAALAQDGLHDADVRIRGSATTFFSANPDKRFPQSAEEYVAQAGAVGMPREEAHARWEQSPFAGAVPLPHRHFFNSRYRLGLDVEPSDFDFQLASGMLAQRLAARFPGARDSDGKLIISAHGGHYKDAYVRQVCPALDAWTRTWSAVANRTLTLAGFGAAGPLGASRFADTDWVVVAPQAPPKE